MTNLLRKYVREVLTESVTYKELDSPLPYRRAGNVKRLALCDSSVTEPPNQHDTYFAEIQKWNRYGKTGRTLKKKRKGELIPGVSLVCIAGFLDFHSVGENMYYLDYMKTRTDMRGKGYATQLVDEFFKRYAKPGMTIHFGKMMRKEVGYLKDKMAKEHPDIEVIGSRDF
mgnify:FL=1